MSWNYRVMRHVGDGEEWLGIHEVYYDDNGKPNGHTEDEIAPTSDEGVDGLRWVLDRMMEALDKPVLDFSEERP